MIQDYTLRRLAHSLGSSGNGMQDILDQPVNGVSTDSRTLKPGEVFFAIKGQKFDGASHVGDAFQTGAVCAVVNRDSIAADMPADKIIPVRDTVLALGDAASDHRRLFRGKVAAVTGTSGKTTAKGMMTLVLETKYKVHSTRGNFNNHIGLPLTVFDLTEQHDCAVFELGMSSGGEIAYLSSIAKPDLGIVLNVGEGHLEFFRDIGEIADAKTELIESLSTEGTALINGDDDLLTARAERSPARVLKFGMGEGNDFTAKIKNVDEDGCASFEVEGHSVKLSVPGVHMVYNSLAAYAAGCILGVDPKNAAEALESFKAPEMRMRVFENGGIKYIDDSYNANPLSMKGAAEVLSSISGCKRKIAVLGDMLEIGKTAPEAHIRIGKLFAELKPHILCFVGANAGYYLEGALKGGMEQKQTNIFSDPVSAGQFIKKIQAPGDVILVKGSRGIGLDKIFQILCGVC